MLIQAKYGAFKFLIKGVFNCQLIIFQIKLFHSPISDINYLYPISPSSHPSPYFTYRNYSRCGTYNQSS